MIQENLREENQNRKVITVQHNKTQRQEIIDCISWDYSKKGNTYEFVRQDKDKIIYAVYSVYNWDIIKVTDK